MHQRLFLVAVHPASDGEHEEVRSMRHRQRLPGTDGLQPPCADDSQGLGRFFAPYAVEGSRPHDQEGKEDRTATVEEGIGLHDKHPNGLAGGSDIVHCHPHLIPNTLYEKGRLDPTRS